LNIFCKQEQVDLIKLIAKEGNETSHDVTPPFLINRLHLTRRELNSDIEKLMTTGCVDMINGTYALTRLGKEVYDALSAIETALKIRTDLERLDRMDRMDRMEASNGRTCKVTQKISFSKTLGELVNHSMLHS
jgi:hypothetical protein